jgi:hypothetical protein
MLSLTEQLKADHHHTASKFPPGFKKQVMAALAKVSEQEGANDYTRQTFSEE